MLSQIAGFPFFFLVWIIFHCVYTCHIFFIHSSVDGHVGCFLALVVVNSAAEIMGEQLSLWYPIFVSFRCISRIKIVVYHDSSVFFIFLRNLHTVFHSDCTNLHSSKSAHGLPFHHHLLPLVFFVISILIGIRWYLTEVLIYVSLMISNVEHLFHVPSGHLDIFFVKMSSQFLYPFFLFLFFYWRVIALQNFVVFCQTSTWIKYISD